MDDEYQEMKKNLRKELVEHYSSIGLTNTSISILIDEEGIDVDDLYVMPELKVKRNDRDKSGSTSIKEEDITIGQMLQKDGKAIKRACIVGEAGYGKTFLCKKIVSSWCKINCSEQPQKLSDNDITFLHSFDFLFYIPLRNCQLTDVRDMIMEHIVRTGLHGSLQAILEKESDKCLIILDGLDEYSSSARMPIIDTREKYSIILTSRPWKIESLRPRQHDLGQVLTLGPIHHNDDLIMAVVESLNSRFGKRKDWKLFKYIQVDDEPPRLQRRDEYKKMEDLAKIPVMLIQMICMWYDGEEVGNTQTEIYKEMLEYLFKVAHKRQMEQTNYTPQRPPATSNQEDDLTSCQSRNFMALESYEKSVISKLAELAYHTLFCKNKEEALIFSHDDTVIYKLSKEEVDVCLAVGLLSKERINRKVTKQEKLLSFIHKTYQEFLAAFYIASKDEKIFREMLKYFDSVDKVMEMTQVLLFLVGLKQTLLNALSVHICDLAESDTRIVTYRKSLIDIICVPSYRIQDLICYLFDECRHEQSKSTLFIELRDIYIDKRYLRKKTKACLCEMIPFLNLNAVRSLTVNSEKAKDVLGCENLGQLRKLSFKVSTQKDIDLVSDMIPRCESNLTSLKLQLDGFSTKIDVSNLFNKLLMLQNLTALCLEDFDFTHDDLTFMFDVLSQFQQLQELIIKIINCGSSVHGQHEYCLDLRRNLELRYLELNGLCGDILLDERVQLIHVDVDSVKHMIRVLNVLKQSVTLRTLRVSCANNRSVSFHENYSYTSGKVFTEVLPTLHNLKTFDLRRIDLQDEDLAISCETKEMDIVLSYLIMTLHCLKRFVDSILQSPHTKDVYMDDVYIYPERDLHAAVQYIRDHCHILRDRSNTDADTVCSISITFNNNK